MRSDTELYKLTYRDLILLVKELDWWYCHLRGADELNKTQAKRIMELELYLRRFTSIMVEDTQETVMKEYGTAKSDVVSLDEFRSSKLKPKTGGGGPRDPGEWLTGMVWGTEFLVRPKAQKTWMLVRFMHAGAREGMVLIIPMRGEEPVQDDREWLWVDPIEFCKYWELMTILLVPKEDDND